MKRKLFVLFSMFAIMAIAFTGCQKDQLIDQKDAVAKTAPSEAGIVPVTVDTGNGGNVECSELDVNYEFSSGRINYDYDEDTFDADFPAGFSVTVTDGKYVTWSYTPVDGMCLDGVTVVVKGGPAANVYTYEAGINGDSGLSSPVNASNDPAGLSNLTFCYNLIPCEEECWGWKDETAWAGLAGPGSAWWFIIDTTEDGPYDIYAGQKLVDGAFVTIDNGILTLTLGDNLMLQDVDEPVKIQGFNEVPKRRPNAGLFTTYKGGFPEEGVNVSGFRYIAVHLDAQAYVLVECPEEPVE